MEKNKSRPWLELQPCTSWRRTERIHPQSEQLQESLERRGHRKQSSAPTSSQQGNTLQPLWLYHQHSEQRLPAQSWTQWWSSQNNERRESQLWHCEEINLYESYMFCRIPDRLGLVWWPLTYTGWRCAGCFFVGAQWKSEKADIRISWTLVSGAGGSDCRRSLLIWSLTIKYILWTRPRSNHVIYL